MPFRLRRECIRRYVQALFCIQQSTELCQETPADSVSPDSTSFLVSLLQQEVSCAQAQLGSSVSVGGCVSVRVFYRVGVVDCTRLQQGETHLSVHADTLRAALLEAHTTWRGGITCVPCTRLNSAAGYLCAEVYNYTP